MADHQLARAFSLVEELTCLLEDVLGEEGTASEVIQEVYLAVNRELARETARVFQKQKPDVGTPGQEQGTELHEQYNQ